VWKQALGSIRISNATVLLVGKSSAKHVAAAAWSVLAYL